MSIAQIVVAGLVLGMPALWWGLHDLAHFPGPFWFWTGHPREAWRAAMIISYALGGWPVLIVVGAWRLSPHRGELCDEERYAERNGEARAPVAPPPRDR